MKRYCVIVYRLTEDYVVGPFETADDAALYIKHYKLLKAEIKYFYDPVPIREDAPWVRPSC